jgi:hypothetical protein
MWARDERAHRGIVRVTTEEGSLWKPACVSYDLAFWDGPAPHDDADAAETFARLCKALEEGGFSAPPTVPIADLVSDLERRWANNDPESPWASMPIRGHAHGPLLYLCLRYGRPIEEIEFIIATARSHGLVCYDPQFSQLL